MMTKEFSEHTVDELFSEVRKQKGYQKLSEKQKPLYEVQRAIIQARIDQNLTQKELAKRCGIHPSDLSKIERGEQNTSVVTLNKIAKGLNREFKISFV